MKSINVLFVCLGNICRSPTAHGVFETLVKAEGLSDIIAVDSAGTGDWHIGHPPDKRATLAALNQGYELSHLRARQVRVEDFSQFDHILAMDRVNLSNLKRMAPTDFVGKLGLFMDYADLSGPAEVPDPYIGGKGDFEQVLSFIENASEGLLRSLRDNQLRSFRDNQLRSLRDKQVR